MKPVFHELSNTDLQEIPFFIAEKRIKKRKRKRDLQRL